MNLGTSIKPANEPICLARKPLSEKSVAENVLKWGTGGINIDGCRIGTDDDLTRNCLGLASADNEGWYRPCHDIATKQVFGSTEGRFPANLILDEIAAQMLDEQSGISKSSKRGAELNKKGYKGDLYTPANTDYRDDNTYGDSGGASRFFYVVKVSKKERNMGLDLVEGKEVVRQGLAGEKNNPVHKNSHPTVKPINLMTYLCRLITPKNGIVLDPFMGSGSTGIAALLEGFRFVGMEMDSEYFKIAESRIENWEKYRELIK